MRLVARVFLASVLALGGCSLVRNATDPAPAATTASPFGGTDRAWLEIAAAMNEGVLPLVDMVPQHSASGDLQTLAAQVKAFAAAELSDLHTLGDAAGVSRVNKHKDMPMPGLITPDQVAKAAKLEGEKFDTLAVKAIGDFLDQTQQLADSESKNGVEQNTRDLAMQIVRTREAAQSTLKAAS